MLWGALAALTASQYIPPGRNLSLCLPDGIPPESRRNLTYDGYDGPVKDIVFEWSSAQARPAQRPAGVRHAGPAVNLVVQSDAVYEAGTHRK